ncbi:hypothetical protein BTBSAS_60116 [Brochothrix thermosphacta]|uniref:Uncharacterized protein n=1 Tax=Brochothrix thermosphacta TaxID=2756 RepID=A0A2X0QNT4_BROTH|nr:hypothetical protein BTBSAS_60116 [Brochothrix thermosphacta]
MIIINYRDILIIDEGGVIYEKIQTFNGSIRYWIQNISYWDGIFIYISSYFYIYK